MEFKGTKGQWENKEIFTHSGGFYKVVCGGVSICNIITRNQEQAEFNAKLITAAPEMFEEIKETIIDLKILRNQIESESKTNHLFDGMPELIQKWIDRKEQLLTKITEL